VIGVVCTVLLVGISEELTFRGLMQVGARRVFAREWQAVAFASALFGLFHLPNSLLGSPLADELPHVVQTALVGLVFYFLRRLSGTIIVPMLVHGIWDLVVLQTNWDAIAAAAL
jgi:membrane protease YdiL (CAAX protease family)